MFNKIKKSWLWFSLLVIFLFAVFLLSRGWIYSPEELSYGVTFSPQQATELGLDYREAYTAVLDDLGVRNLRLPAYWDEVEPEPGDFDWTTLDWLISEAGKRNARVILAVGGRLPRWPECHFPDWADGLAETEREQATLTYIETVVRRYQSNNTIDTWQVENEPFLPHFGECPEPDPDFLDAEIALVRSLDSRPILLSDSGELSLWVPAAKRSDIFGTTMYRDTYSNVLKRYIHYPIEPGFFRFKRNITRLFARPEKWIVVELQAEPWGPRPFQALSPEERDKTMNLEKFRDILEFSRQAGFQEFYLWGVEWWLWEKEVNNNPALWDEARKLFTST